MFLTRPSPRLAIFIACYVARAGEGLGTRLYIHYLNSINRGCTVSAPFHFQSSPRPFCCRRVHVAEKQSLPPVTTAFVEFLHSEPLCRLLSHLTGLDLAEDVIRPNAAFDEEPCSSASGGCEYSVGVYGNGSSKEEDIEGVGEEETKLSDGSRKLPPAASSTSSSSCPDISVSKNSKLGPSSSIPDNDLGHKLNCTNAPAAPSHKDQASGVVTRQEQHHETHHHCHSAAAAKVRGELLCFQPGDYTLVSDQDPTIAECALDLMLHFSCNGQCQLYNCTIIIISVLTITSVGILRHVYTHHLHITVMY